MLSNPLMMVAPQLCPGRLPRGGASAMNTCSAAEKSKRPARGRLTGRPLVAETAAGLSLFRLGLLGDLERQRLEFHRLLAAGFQRLVALGGDPLQSAQVGARAGRNQPADDDVLLQAL